MPFLFLDSRDAITAGTPGDCLWILNNFAAKQGWAALYLYECQFTNVFPSFRTGIDDTLIIHYWSNGGGSQNTLTYTIPAGQYTLTQLITELNTLLQAQVPACWGVGNTHALIASTSSINTTNTITFSVPVADQDGRGFEFEYSSGGVVSTAAFNCGLQDLARAFTVFPATVNSVTGNTVTLSGPDAIQIVTSSFGLENYSSAQSGTQVLARLQLDVPFGDMFTYRAQIATPERVNMQSLKQVRFRLQDQNGVDLVFPDQAYILYTFWVDESIA